MSTLLRLAQSYPVQAKFGNEIIAFKARPFQCRVPPFEEIAFPFESQGRWVCRFFSQPVLVSALYDSSEFHEMWFLGSVLSQRENLPGIPLAHVLRLYP